MNTEAVKELLYKMADDLLIIGHRNSEWTGLGPILEEDIAFSSMAQDKIGQSQALFQLLHELGEQEPDTVAFTRNANQFHNAQFVELPNGDYDFSFMTHLIVFPIVGVRLTSSITQLRRCASVRSRNSLPIRVNPAKGL